MPRAHLRAAHEPPEITPTGGSVKGMAASGLPGWRVRAQKLGPLRRAEACACGTDISAEIGWEAAAVDAHNLSLVHQAWRRRHGL